MTPPPENPDECACWYVLKAQTKREYIAAEMLRQRVGIEVFAPRLRYRKSRAGAMTWFVEALFPGYLFARFVFAEQHRAVCHSAGICGMVHFGEYHPILSATEIDALRGLVGDTETVIAEPDIRPGDAVRIGGGPFCGLAAVVQEFRPAKDRVKVLLEFLGTRVQAELGMQEIEPDEKPRLAHKPELRSPRAA